VYVFNKEGKRYFLRFADSTERTREAIESEMSLLHWIADKGMAVAAPILSKNGLDVETVETDIGIYHAVVFAGLQGVQFDIEELDTTHFEAWGATLGKLHATMHGYRDASLSARSTWRDHLEFVRMYVPKNDGVVQAELEQITSLLSSLPITETNFGIIHFDFELDNLIWQENAIAMLDFDDCSHYWYVADIAFALRDLFEDHVDPNNSFFNAFIKGYSKQYPLDEDLISHLSIFRRMINIFTYAKLIRSVDIANERDYPDIYKSLILKLKNVMHRYKASLRNTIE
jgi:Ser/Thr protein kinase RdoA (MazF antagonist)